jgi:flagellar basal-body rod protein FlgC
MFDALDIPASALTAQRARMDTIAGNVANIDVTRNANGEKIPYRRKFVVLAPGSDADAAKPGVHVQSVQEDQSAFRKVYDPGNADAGPDGYVQYPNVDLAIEQVNMMEASRAYDANVTIMDTMKAMIASDLRLIA